MINDTIFFHNPERDGIYSLVCHYYDDPIMTKMKDVGQDMSMYVCRLNCLLMNEKRYLIVLVHRDSLQVGRTQRLSGFRWVSFMARTLQEEGFQSLPIHHYSIKRDDKYSIPLRIRSRNQEVSVYDSDIGVFTLSLLHNKNQEYEYPNEGNLVSALETFQTVIQWKS
jgi:hypothetical protein